MIVILTNYSLFLLQKPPPVFNNKEPLLSPQNITVRFHEMSVRHHVVMTFFSLLPAKQLCDQGVLFKVYIVQITTASFV